jgi:hypothetical protein
MPLIGLLTTGNPMAKERAATALMHVSSDSANGDAIIKAGGINNLCQLLNDSTAPRSHEPAMATLAHLARNGPDGQMMIAKKLVSLLSVDSKEAKRRFAHMLRELAANNEGASVRIVNAGGISPLVSLLGTGQAETKQAAIGALSCLAENEASNQLAIATGLVKLIQLENSHTAKIGTLAEQAERVEQIMASFAAAADFRTGLAEVLAIWLPSEAATEEDSMNGGMGKSTKAKGRSKTARRPKSSREVTRAGAYTTRVGKPPPTVREQSSDKTILPPPKLLSHRGVSSQQGTPASSQRSQRGTKRGSSPKKSRTFMALPELAEE